MFTNVIWISSRPTAAAGTESLHPGDATAASTIGVYVTMVNKVAWGML